MGRITIDQAADYSAAPVGHVGLITSVSSGLIALHSLRYSRSKSCNNSAPNKWGGIAVGAPTYNTTSINADINNFIEFGHSPVSGGLTMAFVVKIKNGGTSNDGVVGVREGNIATQGTLYAVHWNRRVQVQANTYALGSTYPFASATTLSPFLDYVAGDDGNYHLFYVVCEDNVAVSLYDAKTGSSSTGAIVGRGVMFDSMGSFRTCPFNGTTAQDIAMFAHWSRPITSNERATFYAEMQQQMGLYGMTI